MAPVIIDTFSQHISSSASLAVPSSKGKGLLTVLSTLFLSSIPWMLSSAIRTAHPLLLLRPLAFSRSLAHHRQCMETDLARPVERSIRTKLTDALQPAHLEVLNESHMHAVPPGSESHFRVLVVSERFEGLSLLQRHRLVNEALREELSSRVHALAIQAKTPQQWDSNPALAKSPACMGGSRHDQTVADKLKAGRD